MGYFAVIREAGPGWTKGGIADQMAVNDHAAFMNELAGENFVLFAGPLAGTEHGRLRALLIINAETEAEITRRLADDPWTVAERLKITSMQRWNLFVGARRLGVADAASAAGG